MFLSEVQLLNALVCIVDTLSGRIIFFTVVLCPNI